MLTDFKKTKIVCTIGPASDSKFTLSEMEAAGMNVARLNFSHGNHEEQKNRIDMVRESCPLTSILLDTKGPEIRSCKMKNENIAFSLGEQLIISNKDVIGDSETISLTYKNLYKGVKPGMVILIDDGLLELEIIKINGENIVCEIKNTCKLGSYKTVSIPDVFLNIKSPTDKDLEDIKWGIDNDVDFIALSFVRNKKEVESVRKILEKNNSSIKLISKIENRQGIDNFDEILEVSDGIMVARGDLAVEIPAEEVPILQKEMINKCNIAGKPVITATQMLESMVYNPRPTRAEVNDIANAVLDGTDAVMLSGETAKGSYPIQSVKQMATICKNIENKAADKINRVHKVDIKEGTISSFITHSVYHATKDISNIKAIIAPTKSGYTARKISRFKPHVPIFAFLESPQIARQLVLSWGVLPILFEHPDTTAELVNNAINMGIEKKMFTENDLVIITAGVPIKTSGTTNMVEIVKIKDYLKFKHQSSVA